MAYLYRLVVHGIHVAQLSYSWAPDSTMRLGAGPVSPKG